MSPHCQGVGGGTLYSIRSNIGFSVTYTGSIHSPCTSEAKERVIFAPKIVSIMSNFSFRENSIAPEPEIS